MSASMVRPGVLALAVVVTASLPAVASGQTPATSGTAAAEKAHATRNPPRSRGDRVRAQGFSVVLVIGDLHPPSHEEDVPPAARKALADMRDFLPYRSYRLLDAAWILCCGTGRTITRLRGPDDRDYELEIASSPAEEASTSVQFILRDSAATDTARAAALETRAAQERAVASAQEQLLTARAKDAAQPELVARLEQQLQELRSRMATTAAARPAPARPGTSRGNPPAIMNTSFTMDLGETVVVGTSRLSGDSRALIALLTAVPPKPSSRR